VLIFLFWVLAFRVFYSCLEDMLLITLSFSGPAHILCPHRGERVKQRKMQVRNWIQNFANRKLLHVLNTWFYISLWG